MTVSMTFRTESVLSMMDEARKALAKERVVGRIRRKDHTVWKPVPTGIADRLGWIESPRSMQAHLDEIRGVVENVRADGLNFALLLGMGGSSLASGVFRKVFGVVNGFIDLDVLDSSDPGAVLAFAERLDLCRTVFIVSTKSGGTVETVSLMKYFYNLVSDRIGRDQAGRHFIAITDPGSALADIASAERFRHTFLNDPEIGGRYSALSYFGLVPAAMIGMDLDRFLQRAIDAAGREFTAHDDAMNGALLGAVLGEFAKGGRDKLTFVFSPLLESFGDWLEQLIAESLGKEGGGILPVVGEEIGPPDVYQDDRVFCAVRMAGDTAADMRLDRLMEAGQPVIGLNLTDSYDLGGQCFFWEMATAVAGWRMAVNPFDQPNVEAAKVLARKMVEQYRSSGELPTETPILKTPDFSVYGDISAKKPEEILPAFFARAKPGAYAALHAYLTPSNVNDDMLQRLRMGIRNRFHLASTTGYGPRFLHSTGQLHKGDGGAGLFVQFTADDLRDAAIPDEMGEPESVITFGILKKAQAVGDRRALVNAGRHVLRIHLHGDPHAGLTCLTKSL